MGRVSRGMGTHCGLHVAAVIVHTRIHSITQLLNNNDRVSACKFRYHGRNRVCVMHAKTLS